MNSSIWSINRTLTDTTTSGRVDLRVMVIMGYSTSPTVPGLEFHYQMVQCQIQNTNWRGLIPLQRCSWCILLPQLMRLISASYRSYGNQTWPIKWNSFFQAAVVSILLYGCTTWTLTKRLEKKLDGNYTRMLRAILNKSWRQHPTRHQLYGHLPPITKTIQVRQTRHAGHCWRSRDELISDVLLWTPIYGLAKVGWPARTYIQQLCEDRGCSPEDLPEAMNDREKWWERVRDICVGGMTWWW